MVFDSIDNQPRITGDKHEAWAIRYREGWTVYCFEGAIAEGLRMNEAVQILRFAERENA